MKTEIVRLSQIHLNQANPRTITDDKLVSLVNSILVLPKMLELRPIVVDDTYTALGGNMRCRALLSISDMLVEEMEDRLGSLRDFKKKTDAEKASLMAYWGRWLDYPTAEVVKASMLSDSEKQEFIIKDNVGFGTWDQGVLAEDWDKEDLTDWGMDDWLLEAEEESEEKEKEGKVKELICPHCGENVYES